MNIIDKTLLIIDVIINKELNKNYIDNLIIHNNTNVEYISPIELHVIPTSIIIGNIEINKDIFISKLFTKIIKKYKKYEFIVNSINDFGVIKNQKIRIGTIGSNINKEDNETDITFHFVNNDVTSIKISINSDNNGYFSINI